MGPGNPFEREDPVNCYVHRAPYPEGIWKRIIELSPAKRSMLDLGCGPGIVARRMASEFRHIVALDAAMAMLELGRKLPGGNAGNIYWVNAQAENADYGGEAFDVIVAAQSIHWMDHACLFPRLGRHIRDNHIFMVADGDEPFEPAWRADWDALLFKWIPIVKQEDYSPDSFETSVRKYQRWIEILGEENHTSKPFVQSIDSFIAGQHSRRSFTSQRLGDRLCEFDQDLEALLKPHAFKNEIEFTVRTRLTWGRIRNRV